MHVNSSMNVIFPKNNPARGCLSIDIGEELFVAHWFHPRKGMPINSSMNVIFPKNNPERGCTLFFQYGFENVFFIIFNIK